MVQIQVKMVSLNQIIFLDKGKNMKLKYLILNLTIILITSACSESESSQNIQVGDTIKITSTFNSSNSGDVNYVWHAPKSSNSSVPRFEIKDNAMYFSTSEVGSYDIHLSIETKDGKKILEEDFSFDAVEFINKNEKMYKPAVFPSTGKQKKVERMLPHFTVQVYSRTIKKEAVQDSTMLYDFGFEDVYIENFKKDGTLYFRVRTGNFNTKLKAERHLDKISKALEIEPKNLWAVENK